MIFAEWSPISAGPRRCAENGRKLPAKTEKKERTVGRRGYYLKKDVKAGDKIMLSDLEALKPWCEIGPDNTKKLRGAKYAVDLKAGEPLGESSIEIAGKG